MVGEMEGGRVMRGYVLGEDGFLLRFQSGLALSVRWSPFHYCEARERMRTIACDGERLSKAVSSHTAELAVIWEGKVMNDGYGWVRANNLPAVMAVVRDYTLPSGCIDFTEKSLKPLHKLIEEVAYD